MNAQIITITDTYKLTNVSVTTTDSRIDKILTSSGTYATWLSNNVPSNYILLYSSAKYTGSISYTCYGGSWSSNISVPIFGVVSHSLSSSAQSFSKTFTATTVTIQNHNGADYSLPTMVSFHSLYNTNDRSTYYSAVNLTINATFYIYAFPGTSNV